MTLQYKSAAEFNSALMIMIQGSGMKEHNESLSTFINMVNGLSGGCSCTRKKRADQINRTYLSMGNILTEGNIRDIKNFFGAEEIEFKFDEEIFLKI